MDSISRLNHSLRNIYYSLKNSSNIYLVTISKILGHYITIIRKDELPLKEQIETVYFISLLLEIKSEFALFGFLREEERASYTFYEEDEQTEIIEMLSFLREKAKETVPLINNRKKLFSSKRDELLINAENKELFLKLKEAVEKIIKKAEESVIFKEKKPKSLKVVIEEIKQFVKGKKEVNFEEIFENIYDRGNIVLTFLAILILAKMKFIAIFQEDPFGKILIKSLK